MNANGTTGRGQPKRAAAPGPEKSNKRSAAGLLLGIIGRIILLALMAVILTGAVLGGVLAGGIYGIIKSTPEIDPETLKVRTFNSYILDVDSNVLAELKQEENRVWIDYAEIPKNLINCYVALEDKRFFEHEGIDYNRIGAALISYLKSMVDPSTDIQGGSTIDQQLIKNLTGNQETTIKRKLQEQWQAIQLEKGLTKEEILTLYLNTIPMGGNFYGIETAAKGYFGKDVRNLTLAESAALTGITNWPNRYMPINEENIEANIERAHLCLRLMLEQELITQAEYDRAKAEKIRFNYNPEAGKVTTTSQQSYFVDEVIRTVKRDLMTQYGYSEQTALSVIYNNGIQVQTTLDPKVQAALDTVFNDPENFAQEHKLTDEPAQGAMVVMDPATGAVRGLYGGQGEKKGSVFNRATQARRSPGSSIKPIVVYAPGIETKGMTAATVVDDVPQYLNGTKEGEAWPRNVEKAHFGLTGIREGLFRSRNVVATLALINHTGIQNGLDYLARVGIDRKEEQYASIAMGGFSKGMTPQEMTAAYTVFANQGVYSEPLYYTKVIDYEGKTLLDKQPVQKQVYSPETIFIMNDMLSDVVRRGTGYPEGIVKYTTTTKDDNGKEKEVTVTIPSAGKTGTTDENKDKWFCGYTPYYVGAAWYGYDVGVKLASEEYNNAKKLWNKVMTQIHQDLPAKPFFETTPANLVQVPICLDSGKRPSALCAADPRGSRVREEWFIKGTEPAPEEVCDVHYMITVDTTQTDAQGRNLQATEFCPPEVVMDVVRIRRPVPYLPRYPGDPYPADVKYEAAEGEFCMVHGPHTLVPPVTDPLQPQPGTLPGLPPGNTTPAVPNGQPQTPILP